MTDLLYCEEDWKTTTLLIHNSNNNSVSKEKEKRKKATTKGVCQTLITKFWMPNFYQSLQWVRFSKIKR